MHVIQLVEYANGSPCDKAGQYLKSFNPDAYGGRGYAVWTPDLSKALRFAGLSEATEVWQRQSTVQLLRPDGKPNRPLTSCSVMFVPLP